MGICSKHWPASYATREAHNKILVPAEPPSVFANVPPSCVPQPAPTLQSDNTLTVRNCPKDELEMFRERDKMDFEHCVNAVCNAIPDVNCFRTVTEVLVVSGTRCGALWLFMITIDVLTGTCKCFREFLEVEIPFLEQKTITRMSELEAAVTFLRNYDEFTPRQSFLQHQSTSEL